MALDKHHFCTFVLCTIIPCQCTSVKSVMMRCGARFSRGFSRFGMQASDVAKSRTVHNNNGRGEGEQPHQSGVTLEKDSGKERQKKATRV